MKWMNIISIIVIMISGTQPIHSTKANDEQKIYIRVWETESDENISMVPSVTPEGLVFGISNSYQDAKLRTLVCIKDGQVIWRGSEIFANGTYYNPLVCGNLVIASGYFADPEDDFSELRTICYTKDGERLWEKRFRPKEYDPVLTINNNMLWIIIDGIISVCDQTTGVVIKNTNIHQMLGISDEELSTANRNDGKESFYDCTAVFFGNSMIYGIDRLAALIEISNDYTLSIKWRMEINDDPYTWQSNFFLLNMATKQNFLLRQKNTLFCHDTASGALNWSREIENLRIMNINLAGERIVLNDKYIYVCYDTKEMKEQWGLETKGYVAHIDSEKIYLLFEHLSSFATVDMATGKMSDKTTVKDMSFIFPCLGDVYVEKNEQLCKYSQADKDQCKIEAVWFETQTDTINLNLCPGEETKLVITVKNNSNIGVFDCKISSVNNKITIGSEYITLKPDKSGIVLVKYMESMIQKESSTCIITVTTDYGATEELKINITKKHDCKEHFNVIWDVPASNGYLIGKTIVFTDFLDKGDDWDLLGFKGIDARDGKQKWYVSSDQLGFDQKKAFVEYISGNTILVTPSSDSNQWTGIDIKKGIVAYKNISGIPMIFLKMMNLNPISPDGSLNFDVFDPQTGQLLIKNLEIEAKSRSIAFLGKVGDKYLVMLATSNNYYDNGTMLVDSSGKVVWKTLDEIQFTRNLDNIGSIFSIKKTEKNNNNSDTSYILSKLDLQTSNVIWEYKSVGYPSVVATDTGFVWVDSFHLACLDSDSGKILWQIGEEYPRLGNVKFVSDMIVAVSSKKDETNNKRTDELLIIDPCSGKVIARFPQKSVKDYHLEGDLLYVRDVYKNPEKNTDITCIDTRIMKVLWTIAGNGICYDFGQNNIFYTETQVSWSHKGKILGKYAIIQEDENPYYDDIKMKALWGEGFVYVNHEGRVMFFDPNSGQMLLETRFTGSRYILDSNSGSFSGSFGGIFQIDGKLLLFEDDRLLFCEFVR